MAKKRNKPTFIASCNESRELKALPEKKVCMAWDGRRHWDTRKRARRCQLLSEGPQMYQQHGDLIRMLPVGAGGGDSKAQKIAYLLPETAVPASEFFFIENL